MNAIRAIAVVSAGVLLGGSIAHADTTDDQFLSDLNRHGITVHQGGSVELGNLARLMCEKRASGVSQAGEINIVMSNGGFVTCDQATEFVHLAMVYYCPKYANW